MPNKALNIHEGYAPSPPHKPHPKPPTPVKKPTHSESPVGRIKIDAENLGNLPNTAD